MTGALNLGEAIKQADSEMARKLSQEARSKMVSKETPLQAESDAKHSWTKARGEQNAGKRILRCRGDGEAGLYIPLFQNRA